MGSKKLFPDSPFPTPYSLPSIRNPKWRDLLLKKEGKILVVDDEPSITDSLRLLLGLEGYKVEIASSYTAARAAIERQPFDLVLTDLQLPDDHQGGLSLLRAVKERAPDTEVIVITGHGTASEAVEATKAGAYYFVEKPFEAIRFCCSSTRRWSGAGF